MIVIWRLSKDHEIITILYESMSMTCCDWPSNIRRHLAGLGHPANAPERTQSIHRIFLETGTSVCHRHRHNQWLDSRRPGLVSNFVGIPLGHQCSCKDSTCIKQTQKTWHLKWWPSASNISQLPIVELPRCETVCTMYVLLYYMKIHVRIIFFVFAGPCPWGGASRPDPPRAPNRRMPATRQRLLHQPEVTGWSSGYFKTRTT